MKILLQLFLPIMGLGVLIGCENEPPVIESVTATPQTFKLGEITTLKCVATDADGDRLSYLWWSNEGQFVDGDSDSRVKWKSNTRYGQISIMVMVYDGLEYAMDSVIVHVEPIGDVLTSFY